MKPAKHPPAPANPELKELEAAIAKGWTCVKASKRYKAAKKRAVRPVG